MFIAALFTVAKTRKQLQCPLLEDWIEKMWCIYTVQYYSATRKDEILPFATTWIDFENMMLSKISQAEKVKNHAISLMWNIKLEATNEQTRNTNKNSQTQTTVRWLPEKGGWG